MKNTEKAITIISLVITIIVLLIIAGTTIGIITNNQGIMDSTEKTRNTAEKETLIQKIEADIFEQKTIKNRTLTQDEIESIVNNYGKIEEKNGEKVVITTEGNYEIYLREITK